MHKKAIALLVLLALSTVLLMPINQVSAVAEEWDDPPRFDEIWFRVHLDPEEAVEMMKDGLFDYLPSVPTYGHYEEMADLGFNTSRCEMAEFAWFGFNCRDYAPPEAIRFPPGTPLQPNNDSRWRTALHYALGTEEKARITAEILGPISYAVDSIIPPAQAAYHNPTVTMGQDQTKAKNMLLDAGFTVEAGVLKNPDGTEVRTSKCWYSAGIAILQRTIEEYCKVWNKFFDEVMGVTKAAGGEWLEYPIEPEGMDFGTIVYSILLFHDFDMITLGWTNLGRFPAWTYDIFHSSKCGAMQYNFGAFINDTADELLETIMFDLDIAKVTDAAKEFQEHFSYEWNPYIVRSSGYDIGIYGRRNPGTGEIRRLANWFAMPSYCSDVDWTWALMHWKDNPSGTCDFINRRLSEPPSELHPWYADELYEWNLLDRIVAGLMTLNPYDLTDLPWIVCDWNVSYWSWPPLEIEEGMKVTFYLRQDVTWHNGDPLTAADVKMNWDMLAEWKPGRYSSFWEYLVYTEIEAPYVVSAYFDATSLWTLYDAAGTALFFPERILEEYEARLHDVADPMYHTPEIFTPHLQDYTSFFVHTHIPVDPAPVDPKFSPIYECRDISDNIGHQPPPAPPKMVSNYKCLIGCNPYIFDYWDDVSNYAHVVRFPDFWWDCPNEQNFIAPTRADPCEPFPFLMEYTSYTKYPVKIAYNNITKDGELWKQVPLDLTKNPFNSYLIGDPNNLELMDPELADMSGGTFEMTLACAEEPYIEIVNETGGPITKIAPCEWYQVVYPPAPGFVPECSWWHITSPDIIGENPALGFEFHVDAVDGPYIHIDEVRPWPIDLTGFPPIMMIDAVRDFYDCLWLEVIDPVGYVPRESTFWDVIYPSELADECISFHVDQVIPELRLIHIDEVKPQKLPVPIECIITAKLMPVRKYASLDVRMKYEKDEGVAYLPPFYTEFDPCFHYLDCIEVEGWEPIHIELVPAVLIEDTWTICPCETPVTEIMPCQTYAVMTPPCYEPPECSWWRLLTPYGTDIQFHVDDSWVEWVSVCGTLPLQQMVLIHIDGVEGAPILPYPTCRLEAKKKPAEVVVECSYYEHHMWMTVKQDIDLNCLVEIKDIVAAALACFSYPGSPDWDPRCDVTPVYPRDFFVDIKDIVNIALHFGEPHPCP